jgi:hypothetical protein
MHILTELFDVAPHVAQALTLLQLAFTAWMLIDAYQRRVEMFWYWVIFLFQPVGAWIYFFAVKFRTMRLTRMRSAFSWERKLSLDELRYCVERAPTVANRFALAERLMAKGAHGEAIPLLEAVLAVEPNYCPVLHALAECRLATNDAEQARAPLEKLIHRDPRWKNYLAWRTLVEVHLARGQPADALVACRELAKRLPTLENKCLLAEHLLDNRSPGEAVQILTDALAEHHFAPWSARWHNGRWARQAGLLLAEAEKHEKMAAEQDVA